jgi:hypothetical protein
MRVSPTDPHCHVWLLALSIAPILIRRDESLQAEFLGYESADTRRPSAGRSCTAECHVTNGLNASTHPATALPQHKQPPA